MSEPFVICVRHSTRQGCSLALKFDLNKPSAPDFHLSSVTNASQPAPAFISSMSTYYPQRGRGSTSGNYRSSPRGRGSFGPHRLPGDRDVMEGLLQTTLQTIPKILSRPNDTEVKVNDLECIGSYNWTDSGSPTIIVPG